ncbi:hypothetical protein Pint_07320 [Pistacia integerrima]|uniref:Uncharacterized protein n=1 Tax=Pistacia integerrima TaxID=434235 RepID=A0ACC0XUT6_9ROSI|nr:hypothetical protein Pint_07320 [Pistacia integerrima]
MLHSIPELPQALRYLDVRNCRRLQSIAEPPSNIEVLSESELEIVSESFYPSSTLSMWFILTNCLKLNQNTDSNILTNSQLRIQHTATLALQICQAKVFDKIPEISFCLPGSEIPVLQPSKFRIFNYY